MQPLLSKPNSHNWREESHRETEAGGEGEGEALLVKTASVGESFLEKSFVYGRKIDKPKIPQVTACRNGCL